MNPTNNAWTDLHARYKTQDWASKPSLFTETAISYFPATGKILELGAGLGQDSQFFTEKGYEVTSTDVKEESLKERIASLPDDVQQHISIQKVDVQEPLPFADATFDVVYAHLSLHYFDRQTTEKIFAEIRRVLQSGGIFAFFVNAVTDPEYGTGEKIEDDYFLVDDKAKRFFSVETARKFGKDFDIQLLDDQGETYKDRAKGVHNLIRCICVKKKDS